MQRVEDIESAIRKKFNIRENDTMPSMCDGTRDDMASLFAELGYTNGAEVGVLLAVYSLVLCQSIPNLKLICIDPWAEHGGRNQGKRDRYYKHCQDILSPYSVKFMRMMSVDAAPLVQNNSLDFVYIDANHDFNSVMMDILIWEPKVRRGGIISGHDYTNFHRFGVIRAVDTYAIANKIDSYFITQPDPQGLAPSWFFVKR